MLVARHPSDRLCSAPYYCIPIDLDPSGLYVAVWINLSYVLTHSTFLEAAPPYGFY